MSVWRRYLRPGVLVGHVLVLAAALTCLRLGWWQWDVAHEARGTVQNLGYALLWPVFAGSFIYMWLRFLHLEATRDAEPVPAGAGSGTDSLPVLVDRHAGGDEVSGVTDRPVTRPDEVAASEPAGEPVEPRAAEAPVTDTPVTDTTVTDGGDAVEKRPRRGRKDRQEYTISVATVGGDDDDDELVAYNQALAALAEQDEHRGR